MRPRRTGLALMRPLLAAWLFVAALAPCPVLAQTNATRAPRSSNRCLLVVETSRAMQRRSEATLQAVQDMLKSGLSGQLRRGDTLGIWTYNESLYAGRFPLQTWSPETQPAIALRILAFLKGQKYEKQAGLEKVLPALNRLIKDSPLITVILVSSGDEKIQGTPFDDPINAFYQKWHVEQQKARRPFVTVLRAKDGQLGDFTVNTPPWPVEMPRLSQEKQPVASLQSQLLEALHRASSPSVPPLILSGKKAQPASAQVKVEAPAPAPVSTNINQSSTVKAPTPAPPPVQIAKAEAAPVVPAKPPPVPVPQPKVEIVKAPELKPVAPTPAPPQVASVPSTPAPAPKPAAVEPPKSLPAPESKPAPATTPLPAPLPVTPSKPVAEPKVEVAKAPEPKPVAATSPKVEVAPVLPTPAPSPVGEASPATNATATTAASTPLVSSPLPVQAAAAAPAETETRNRNIWLAGIALAGMMISLAFLMLRRSRAVPEASLITRSFERKRKS